MAEPLSAWFEGLSADTQALIRECAEQACRDANAQIVASMDSIKESFVNDYGCEIYELSPEEIDVFKAAVADVTAQYAAEYGADACVAFGIKLA